MEIGKKIKELRKINKLTQSELAKELSIGQSTICEWEKGEYEPTASAIKRLAIFFDTSADYLLDIKEYDGTNIKQTQPQTNYDNPSFNIKTKNHTGNLNIKYK